MLMIMIMTRLFYSETKEGAIIKFYWFVIALQKIETKLLQKLRLSLFRLDKVRFGCFKLIISAIVYCSHVGLLSGQAY